MNGYTYTYKYGSDPVIESDYVPLVFEQESKKIYTQSIYPSDIAYNVEEARDELKVYVVYKIDVQNTEAVNVTNKYVETIDNEGTKGKLYLESLINRFDSERYELASQDNPDDSQDFALWSDGGNGVANYDLYGAGSAFADGIKSHETKSTLIQFKLTENFLESILKGDTSDSGMDRVASQAEMRGYHEYLREDNLWDDSGPHEFDECRGSDDYAKDDNDYIHKSRVVERKTAQLSIVFKLGDERVLSGTVFEDGVTEDSTNKGEHLGDGIFDEVNEENRGQNVTVELLDVDKNPAKLYKRAPEEADYATTEGAIATTNEKGEYSFKNVVPGLYWLRFTYGDGTQTMTRVNDSIKSNDYRSTIINTEGSGKYIQSAMETDGETMVETQENLLEIYKSSEANNTADTDEQKLVEWYKYTKDNRYSIAIDNLEQRSEIKDYVYKEDGKVYTSGGEEVTNYPRNIQSDSPMFSISIENDKSKYTGGNADVMSNEGMHSPEYGNFNFGLIDEIRTELEINKKITNVKFTVDSATVLVSSNPKGSDSMLLTDLDMLTDGGSKYARLELPPDKMYGSDITTTYEVIITNNTLKDYIEDKDSEDYGTYFKYGKITSESYLKQVTVDEVVDELDEKYTHSFLDGDVDEFINRVEAASREGSTQNTVHISANDDRKEIIITNWDGIESGSTTRIAYTAKSLLTRETEDSAYVNAARISAIKLDYLSGLVTSNRFENDPHKSWKWDDPDLHTTTTLLVVPDTGGSEENIGSSIIRWQWSKC